MTTKSAMTTAENDEPNTGLGTNIPRLVRKKVFINFALDITKECDCISGDDPRIIDDAGIFASDDILAADKACFDRLTGERDIFSRGGKITTHLHQIEYARRIGLGNPDYTLLSL